MYDCGLSAQSRPVKVLLSFVGEKLAGVESAGQLAVRVFIAKRGFASEANLEWVDSWHTEAVPTSSNPTWTQKASLSYNFEELQLLKFQVDNLKGGCFGETPTLELSRLLCATSEFFDCSLLSGDNEVGKLRIGAKEATPGSKCLVVNASGNKLKKMDTFSKTDGFLRIFREQNGKFVLVHETEVIDNSLAPTWKQFVIPVERLQGAAGGSTKLLVECFDEDRGRGGTRKEEYMGEFTTSLDELSSMGEVRRELEQVKTAKKGSAGEITLRCQTATRPSFIEYLRGGLQVQLAIAIDFTASNGPSSDPKSLHSTSDNFANNHYLPVLDRISSILEPYDFDGKIPLYGFGARRNDGAVGMCFPLAKTAEVFGVDGVLAAYKACLPELQFSGPSENAPVIKKVTPLMDECSQKYQRYNVLLMLSDGEIADFAETCTSVVKASERALSIILVGIGEASFDALQALDGTQRSLRDPEGKAAARDIVQFVPLKSFKDARTGKFDAEKLAAHVLAEIPAQVIEFMNLKGIQPNSKK